MFSAPDVDRLFDPDIETRLDRLTRTLNRFNGDDAEYRLDRLAARMKALLPPSALAPSVRHRIVKEFAGQQPRPGYVVGDPERFQLETVPSEANVAGVNEEERSCFGVLTTGAIDRVGDIVRPEGADLTGYRFNPIVIINHRSEDSLPVATTCSPYTGKLTVALDRANDRLTARLYFAKDNDLAGQAWSLVKEGILRGLSIGFNPLSPPCALPTGGNEFRTWELLEVSLVCVPCNPHAVILAEDMLAHDRIEGRALHPALRKAIRAGRRLAA